MLNARSQNNCCFFQPFLEVEKAQHSLHHLLGMFAHVGQII